MFHQEKSKLKHLLFFSLLILFISKPSHATWPILDVDRIYEGINMVGASCTMDTAMKFIHTTMSYSENDKTKNQDSIRSFNGSYISKSRMEAFIKHQMDSLNIPGLSIAFINDDKIVYHNALGVKNMETLEKVDNSTIFDAASISKTVFSFFTMKMIDDGLLDLDTPLYTYMEYPDIAYDERYKSITARMVLSHTSGFPNWRFLDNQGNYNPGSKLTIQFEPGSKFQYSGEGYEYLAKVIAHLKGVEKDTLQNIIRTEIFDPLAMKNSSFIWNNYLE
ncbi:MAG: serine hydrolase domain-containing protein, partial [Bacteroidota bacterium]